MVIDIVCKYVNQLKIRKDQIQEKLFQTYQNQKIQLKQHLLYRHNLMDYMIVVPIQKGIVTQTLHVQ